MESTNIKTELSLLNEIIFQAYNLGTGSKLDANVNENVLDNLMYEYLKTKGYDSDYRVEKVGVEKKEYGVDSGLPKDKTYVIPWASIFKFSPMGDTIEDEVKNSKPKTMKVYDISEEIDCINNIIEEAIYHGGDSEGAYYSNIEGITEAIRKYLVLKNLVGKYMIGIKEDESAAYCYEFDEMVQIVKAPEKPTELNFATAMTAVKNGKRVRRSCWTFGDYVEFVSNVTYKNFNGETTHIYNTGSNSTMMKVDRFNNITLFWRPNADDIQADDWEILI